MPERVIKGELPVQGVGEDPLYHYSRVFALFLQAVFGHFEKGHNRWTADEQATEIIITEQAPIGREVVERRPAIVLALGPAGSANISLDQMMSTNQMTQRRLHTDLMSCTMSLNVLAKEGPEARRIAWQCFRFIRAFKRELMKAGMHRVGEEMQIGSESAPGAIISPESDSEMVMVTVSVPFYFQDFWAVEPTDKNLLTQVILAVRSEMNYPSAESTLRGPAMNGKPLVYTERLSLDSTHRVSRLTKPKPRS